jgi:2-phospho-L-lactate/phosphoenolpyruvate guanylyltransferase
MTVCAITLIKDFRDAKLRLAPALSATQRRELAIDLARRALNATSVADERLAIVGSEEAAKVATECGVEPVVEPVSNGQNPAAALGIGIATKRGADAVLVLSSDLPLVDGDAIRWLVDAEQRESAVVIAAMADGRGGTNALFMRPPGALPLCFGDDSLRRFHDAALMRGVKFIAKHDPRLSLDLDEPSDLAALERLQTAV